MKIFSLFLLITFLISCSSKKDIPKCDDDKVINAIQNNLNKKSQIIHFNNIVNITELYYKNKKRVCSLQVSEIFFGKEFKKNLDYDIHLDKDRRVIVEIENSKLFLDENS